MPKSNLISLILFLALLLPNKSFEIYYLVIGSLLVSSSFLRFKFSKLLIILVVYTTLLIATRSILWNNIVEFKELVKILFMILSFIYLKTNREYIKSKNLFLVIGSFTILNFIVTISLVFDVSDIINSFVLNHYTAESQRILYTFSSIRSTGLSSGVGQQGIVSLMSIIFFKELPFKTKFRNIFFVLAILTLMFSQSKTAVVLGLLYLIVSYRTNFYLLIALSISSFFLLVKYLEMIKAVFRELFLLFNGTSFSSFDERISNWKAFLTPMFEKPVGLIFGLGRGYFQNKGQKSSVFDSDLIYVIVNFGIIGLIFLLIFLIHYLKPMSWSHKFAMTVIILTGFTLNPIFEPKLFIFFTLLLFYFKSINHASTYLDSN